MTVIDWRRSARLVRTSPPRLTACSRDAVSVIASGQVVSTNNNPTQPAASIVQSRGAASCTARKIPTPKTASATTSTTAYIQLTDAVLRLSTGAPPQG